MASKTEILDDRNRARGALVRDWGRSLKESLIYLATHFWVTCFVWLLIGISLSFPGGLWLLYDNLNESLLNVENRLGLTVYLDLGVSDSDIQAIKDEIDAYQGVTSITVTTSTEALKELLDLSNLPTTVADNQFNPLPASLNVRLDPSATSSNLTSLRNWTLTLTGVSDVVEDRYWIERNSMFLAVLERLNIVGALISGLSGVLIAATAVRLAVNERVGELRVMDLLGTPPSYQRKVFQFCGLFYGTGGGLTASIVIVSVILFLKRPVIEYGSRTNLTLDFSGIDALFVGTLLGISALLGVLGATLSSAFFRRKLRRENLA